MKITEEEYAQILENNPDLAQVNSKPLNRLTNPHNYAIMRI